MGDLRHYHSCTLDESSYSLTLNLDFQVSNKSDMSDFYRNLLKSNVAFGARNVPKSSENHSAAEKGSEPESQVEDEELKPSTSTGLDVDDGASGRRPNKEERNHNRGSSATRDKRDSRSPSRNRDGADRVVDLDDQKANVMEKHATDTAEIVPAREEEGSPKGSVAEPPKLAPVDPVAAAKERYLARKRQRGL